MKKYVISIILGALLVGCQTGQSPESKAFTAISSIIAATKPTMDGFDDYIQTHKLTPDQLDSAITATTSYKRAIEEAKRTVADLKAGKATQSQADIAINIASNASSAVLDIITPIITKK